MYENLPLNAGMLMFKKILIIEQIYIIENQKDKPETPRLAWAVHILCHYHVTDIAARQVHTWYQFVQTAELLGRRTTRSQAYWSYIYADSQLNTTKKIIAPLETRIWFRSITSMHYIIPAYMIQKHNVNALHYSRVCMYSTIKANITPKWIFTNTNEQYQ